MGTLRAGFIGCGVIASAHASALHGLREAGLADVEIAVVSDSDSERADRFGRYFGATSVASIEELAADSDVVYVCTSTQSHFQAVRAAAAAGRAIFCEKPLARNLDESLELAAVAVAAGVPVQVGLVLRTAPVYKRLEDIVAGGQFGRPMAAIVRDDQFFPTQGHYASTWRSDVTIAGAGALLEHSIHDIDIIQACFGSVEFASANLGFFGDNEGIEDSVSALLRTTSGLSISLVSVWHQVLTRPSTRRVEVLFEEAFVSFEDDFTGPLNVQTSAGTESWPCPPPAWIIDVPIPSGERGLAVRPYIEENRDFIDAVQQGNPPAPGLDEAVAAHRVVDACYRSAGAGGGPISLAS
ncbi:MAG: Gfo/Idh/MocA family oxidoreductase [Acidimicrobiales bacterium]|jgi:myo-inositol 2-dehydrogenase/D-chiro-inositol 1-dehydrogenase